MDLELSLEQVEDYGFGDCLVCYGLMLFARGLLLGSYGSISVLWDDFQ